ncbi:MAG TPA: hypothetical protein VIT65_13960 [Microlunatus sp.]
MPTLDAVPLVELTFHPDGDGTLMVSEFTLSDRLDLDTVRSRFDLGVRTAGASRSTDSNRI